MSGVKTQRLDQGRTPPSNLEKAYAVIKESEAFLNAVVDNLPVALFAKDADDGFRFVLWNKKQEEITTIRREKAMGRTDFDLFSRESADYFRQVDETVVRRNKMFEVPEEIMDTGNGGEIWLHTIKVPISDPANNRHMVVGISEDITERIRSREQLRKLNENLSQANQELKATQLQLIQAEKMESIGRLAAGVAHEVKNPLALLLMGVEYLSDGINPADENVPVIMAEMREAINRADKIIRGLVDFSSQRQLDLQDTNVCHLVQNALLLVRHEITRNSIGVTTDFEESLPEVRVDPSKLEQVLVNLLMNAIHAMEETKRGQLSINVFAHTMENVERDEGARTADRLRPGDQVVMIEIADNGRGIPAENLRRIFDPFFTTKATGVGTGLGLSVVKKIIELHKGTISLQNRPTSGVIVRVGLKVHKPKPEDGEKEIGE